MKIIVLGSAAGGGFPQWNCNCRNCKGVRDGSVKARCRTQSSIAVSSNGKDWLLINASPDILAQIKATPALQAKQGTQRSTGIAAVMLMDAQIDHVTGLLMLREGASLPLYCSAAVWDELTNNFPVVHVLSHYCGVHWHVMTHQREFVAGQTQPHLELPFLDHLVFTPVLLTSKAPPYSPHRGMSQPGDNLGLLIEDKSSQKKLFYAPGLGEIDASVHAALSAADCVLVDGTFWTDDEMIRLGYSEKTAREIGHLPQAGEEGMISVLDAIGNKRKILIHINNTNPILDEDSAERATLTQHGIEVAYDGMEIEL